jgi:hypothetical protein
MSRSTLPLPVHHWWVDAVLLGVGVAALAAGWYLVAAVAVAAGLPLPLIHLFGVRGHGIERALTFAPDEIVAARERLQRAALPLNGSEETRLALEQADEIVLEAAAIFGGRPARGSTHERYVRQRCAVLDQLALALAERAGALDSARVEIEELDGIIHGVASVATAPSDPLATALLWLLSPVFIAWEIGAMIGRAGAGFAVGVVLRVRTIVSLSARGWRSAGRTVIAVFTMWRDVRRRFLQSWEEARRRFVTVEFTLRLRLRRASRM